MPKLPKFSIYHKHAPKDLAPTLPPTAEKAKKNFKLGGFRQKPGSFKKRYLILGLLVLLLLLFWIARPASNHPKISPQAQITAALDHLLALESLRFKTESKLTINDTTNIYGKVEGEKAGAGNFHAWGMVLGSNLDIYQVQDTTYRKDSLTEKWLVIPNSQLLADSMILDEINPLSSFVFTAIQEPKRSTEKLEDGETYQKLQFKPETANPYLSNFFQELTCTLWLTQQQQICKAQITAVTTTNAVNGVLCLDMEFWDWGKEITITPPVVQ